MKTILSILDELAATNSSTAKVAILKRECDNALLKQVFVAAYNPMITYGVKAIPEYSESYDKISLSDAINGLCVLSNRSETGNRAIEWLTNLLSRLSPDNATVLKRIIDRDLRCGCSDNLASRVWPGFVPVFDVMLCDKDMTRIKYPAFAQRKMDGCRVHLYYDGESVTAFSRTGKQFELRGMFDVAAIQFMKPGETFDGELLVVIDGKIADRQTGNGILNSANRGTITQEEANCIRMVVWDIVDVTSTIPYAARFAVLVNRNLNDKLALVDSIVVNSEEQAMDYFQEQLAAGEEGAIIKNMSSMWVPKRSKDSCKLKEVNTADLIVVGLEEGTGKNIGKLGALVCATSDGLLQVKVGTGFTDGQRVEYWNINMIDTIIEVLYNQKIVSKSKETASLFLPRFSVKRFDKSVANSIEEIK